MYPNNAPNGIQNYISKNEFKKDEINVGLKCTEKISP
jgi:hypothetical protein